MIKKLISKLVGVKFWLALALLFAGVFDILTTLPSVRFETNPIYFFVGQSTILLVIVKFLLIGLLIRVLYMKHPTDLRKFFNVTITILAILGMLFAGASNIFFNVSVAEYEAETGQEVVQSPASTQMLSYLMFMLIIFIYPLIACVSSFLIYRRIKENG